MPIGDICVRDVVIAAKDMTVREAAKLMRQNHVGDLVVTEENTGGRHIPLGIVTDRDLVLSVIATTLDPSVFTVGDLLIRDVVTVSEDQGIFESIQHMRKNGVRRMPVVDRHGGLVGIISIDDLIQLLGEEMGLLAKLLSQEQLREAQTRV